MVDSGQLLLAGAFAEPTDGACFAFAASTTSEIEAFAKADPYVVEGLVTEWEVRQWSVVAGDSVADVLAREAEGGPSKTAVK